MSKKEIFKRYVLFIISLFFSALGNAFTKQGALGLSPIPSVANIFSLKFTFLSLGVWMIIWNCTLILGQVVVLRKNFQLIQLLQVPLSFLFGWFTDIGVWMVSFIPVNSYITSLILTLVGTAISGFGIALSVVANVIMNCAEALVKAISDTIHREFGNIKIAFDVFCVLISVTLSLCFFNFTIVEIREGTIISALLTGLVVKFFTARLDEPFNRILKDKQ